jgi:hypothetical protein
MDQIGRTDQIEALEEKLGVNDVVLLMEGRRTGKTSLAAAALDRVREARGRVAVATLTRFQTYERAAMFIDAQLQTRAKRGSKSLAQVLTAFRGSGAPELMPPDAAAALGIADKLAEAQSTLSQDLADVLASCPGPGAVLLDEAHAMLSWAPNDKGAVNAVLRGNLNVGVVLASSDSSALERLTAEGEALYLVGSRVRPDPITTAAWFASLRERFHVIEIDIGETVIFDLIDQTDGHPYLTMRLCREVAERATRGTNRSVVTQALLDASVYTLSQDDPVWRELHGAG